MATQAEQSGAARADAARHPLDPLSAEEIRQAVTILRGDGWVRAATRFVSVALHEPPKSEIASFAPGQAVRREAFVVILDPREHVTYEAVVSITAGSVLCCRPVPGARAPITLGEYAACQELVQADREFREGLRRRGIGDPGLVLVEPWGIGGFARDWRLVVSFIITAGNYEYAFYWYFYTDGSIELEIKLTGVVLTAAQIPGETSDYGTIVAPQTLAAHHQHFFSVRLDMAVDGPANSVCEVETEPWPAGPDNPYRNAFRPRRTLLRTESVAQRLIDPLKARHWLVTNPNMTNSLGEPVGYKLIPHGNVLPFARDDSSVIKRGAFMTRHLWVTPFAPR